MENCGHDEVQDNATLSPYAFTSKSLSSAEWHYSNIECESLGILHLLEKFHHCCFGGEVYIITDQKPSITIFSNDVATLSQQLQCIILYIHLYRVRAWPRLVHCRLTVQEQPCRRSTPGNHWHEPTCECHQHSSKYASMHIHRGHTGSNM